MMYMYVSSRGGINGEDESYFIYYVSYEKSCSSDILSRYFLNIGQDKMVTQSMYCV